MNDYLREITGQNFTAKDFRTWAGTVLATSTLAGHEPGRTESEAKQHVVDAIKGVADQLGNTPAVCRQFYVHPGVLDCYIDGSMQEILEREMAEEGEQEGLHPEELAVMALLRCVAEKQGAG